MGKSAYASDNVLQAIQVDGVKDSYNVILKSDDVAEVKKTVQAPNKMILTLNGIRASKTINTIYNNTSNVDSVVVEPMGEDSVKILIQAANASNAEIHFDTLKTPLGVLDKSANQGKSKDELVLNGPMKSYKPVYDDSQNEENINTLSVGSLFAKAKNTLKEAKLTWFMLFGLFVIAFLNSIKTIKGKDNEIKVGLTQSLKNREIDLYRNGNYGVTSELSANALTAASAPLPGNMPGANYGLKAYQNSTRSSYLSPETQRQRPAAQQPVSQPAIKPGLKPAQKAMTMGAMANTALKTAPMNTQTKVANIDSMKFLESMTKIYEKNGRSDLAQGLKSNIKKAKVNMA